MTQTPTEQTVSAFLSTRDRIWPPTAMEIAEKTGFPLSTVYVALKSLRADRVKRDKNQFGYVMPEAEPVDFPSVTEALGTVDGHPWARTAEHTLRVTADASISEDLTAAQYAEGFKSLGLRFLELAAHAAAVEDRPDWKIVLGISPDTEKE